jgi:hypothetical protein
MSEELVKCQKPDCFRLVLVGAAYCCNNCRIADEGKYEIDQHSSGCDERYAARQKEFSQVIEEIHRKSFSEPSNWVPPELLQD